MIGWVAPLCRSVAFPVLCSSQHYAIRTWGETYLLKSKPSCSYRQRPHCNQAVNRTRPGGNEGGENISYIGQRAQSAIQSQKPSFNTYYSCPFSQSGNLKPSSCMKARSGGPVMGFVISSVERSLNSAKVLMFLIKTLLNIHMCTRIKEQTPSIFTPNKCHKTTS